MGPSCLCSQGLCVTEHTVRAQPQHACTQLLPKMQCYSQHRGAACSVQGRACQVVSAFGNAVLLGMFLFCTHVCACRRQEQQAAQHRSNQQQLARKAAATAAERQEDAAFRCALYISRHHVMVSWQCHEDSRNSQVLASYSALPVLGQ